MRIFKILMPLAIAALLIGHPTPSDAQVYVSFSAPPLMPEYTQPPVMVANEIWTPGYWAMGPAGYYWVPGTWMQAPQQGLLWTPGYWGYQQQQNNYAWNQGYWGQNVGYYGGINYGAGYYGNGYVGGGWYGNQFRYNTAVTSVNPQYIRNVYVNRTVIVHNVYRYGYNGPGGVRMHPDAQQITWAREQHVGLTPAQRQHISEAAQDRNMYANVNHGKPNEVVVSRPLNSTNRPADFKPLTATDRTSAKFASEPANKPATKTASKPESHMKPAAPPQHAMKPASTEPKGKTAPAMKPVPEKAPQEKATHAPTRL